MRRSSLWLTVLLIGGVPLTAAAVDYGPNAPLLAADTNAPQLPGSQAGASARGEMSRPDVTADSEDAGSDAAPGPAATPQHMTPSASSPHAAAPARGLGTARNKPSAPASHPAQTPPTASWQSLLPGSIQ
ncbi:MAG: hypothetical protein OJF61_000314 [Rhodanobacteraceae bacterium]|jgi:hypothetical protein|nr:MAG: hypothetical protein OJF61_000314 [Rhodanobacteraceae bacterium]